MREEDPFFTDHRAYHERQQARQTLLCVGVAVAFLVVVLMLIIAFRPV